MDQTGSGSVLSGRRRFGQEIFGQTLGIIGLGNIGAAIPRRRGLSWFPYEYFVSRAPRKIENWHDAFNARFCELDELLEQSDFIVVAVDLNAHTQHLIDAEAFKEMQCHAVFVNISRGAVVDEQALIQALEQKQIFAAGLDVYEKEPLQDSALFQLHNVDNVAAYWFCNRL